MTNALVLFDRDAAGVVTLTLNRPQAFNALSEGLLHALQAAIDQVAADATVRVLVIAAAGKAFCAGHDLKEMRAAPSQAYYERLFAQCGRMMMSLQKLPVPVIAQVHGMATAAGCQLVALSRNLGRKAAFEMLVTGSFISADEALAKGLVNRVVDAEQLTAEVHALAASITSKPRVALAMGKALFYRQLEAAMQAAYEDAGRTMACNMMDGSALEGVQAFIDKRPPDWK